MEIQKILFLRNFLFRTFLIGLGFAVLLFAGTIALRSVWSTFLPGAFGLETEEVSEAMLASLLNMRIVLLFMLLAPALALHWLAKQKFSG